MDVVETGLMIGLVVSGCQYQGAGWLDCTSMANATHCGAL